jgi:serine/threonine-protein kinase ULK/ATG1
MKKTPNNFYLIMEYCNDGDLDAYVKKRKYLTEDEAVEILCEIIHGFQHLYKHNILHRDLKLANILRHDGVIKIADFGFSKMMTSEQLASTMLGSPLNMAP